MAYALIEENALFPGDHIMGWSTTVIGPPDGDMTAYFASLEKVRDRDYATLWPTHGPPVRDVRPFVQAFIWSTAWRAKRKCSRSWKAARRQHQGHGLGDVRRRG
jgi:glyoxylase-like metal-dependent hydrolase (beta-lactamase superfamily II)